MCGAVFLHLNLSCASILYFAENIRTGKVSEGKKKKLFFQCSKLPPPMDTCYVITIKYFSSPKVLFISDHT